MLRKWLAFACLAAGIACVVAPAQAQDYPARPIHLIVPFTPGGGTDLVARAVAAKAGQLLGGSIIVDNRAGAGGTIGTEFVARADPDGYTLGLVSGSHAINPSIYPHLPYDTVRDFAPVTQLVAAPGILVTTKSLPVQNVGELIKLAKSEPGKLFFASAGIGTPPHLAGELFKNMAGIDVGHVPYKGNAPVLTDLISGRVAFSFPTLPSAMPYVRNGTLRALGVTSAKRSPSAPDIPTIAEAGLPGYEATSWYGVVAPAKTPPAIVAKINDAFVRALQDPSVKKVLANLGLDSVGSTPSEFTARINTDMAKWATLIKQNHIALAGGQ
ncbi:tripartite tricarboxylate transporter substrate binding protein [Paraburkholderia sp. ZP32-5]|uniref:tripartite tricarboxylate transporter substrate binding protein n=1 Tax=Paraburkholderia sp. ZP32-5 TaxID=2883245 RepID=UPI001F3744A8|nr:tripartite tricarboxylate transporter substrate binding protein [Paraburkholderia sp. ZP32-5]